MTSDKLIQQKSASNLLWWGDWGNWSQLKKSLNKMKAVSGSLTIGVTNNSWLFILTASALLLLITIIDYNTKKEYEDATLTTITPRTGEWETHSLSIKDQIKFNKSTVSVNILHNSNENLKELEYVSHQTMITQTVSGVIPAWALKMSPHSTSCAPESKFIILSDVIADHTSVNIFHAINFIVITKSAAVSIINNKISMQFKPTLW